MLYGSSQSGVVHVLQIGFKVIFKAHFRDFYTFLCVICFGLADLNKVATLISSLLQTEQFRIIVRGLQRKHEQQGPVANV